MANWTGAARHDIGRGGRRTARSARRGRARPTPRGVGVWVVRHGDDLYVRSGYGNRAAWYRGTQQRRDGHIMAGGVTKDGRFEEAADPARNDRIELASRSQY